MIQKNKNLRIHSFKIWVITIVVSMAALYIVSLTAPVLSGYAWFPIAHIQCGTQPYIASNFSASRSYTVPGDGLYKGPSPFTTPDEYYCSRGEVEEAHYRPYEWGERCRTNEMIGQTHCASGGNGYVALLPFFTFLIIGSAAISVIALRFPYVKTRTSIKKLLNKRKR